MDLSGWRGSRIKPRRSRGQELRKKGRQKAENWVRSDQNLSHRVKEVRILVSGVKKGEGWVKMGQVGVRLSQEGWKHLKIGSEEIKKPKIHPERIKGIGH